MRLHTAANQPSQVTELRYFTGLALEKLGRQEEAKEVYQEMISTADRQLENADLPGYFGVGMSAPLPYEQNIVRQNTINACLLKALGNKGLGNEAEYRKALHSLEELDPTNFKLSFLKMLEVF